MERPRFDIVASGERMREIRRQRNISVKQVMEYMGFESTQAVYVIGAGASGLTAAIYAARGGCKVHILEAQDRPAKKILATGNGKCNYTNEKMALSCYRSAFISQAEEVLSQYPPSAAINYLKSSSALCSR